MWRNITYKIGLLVGEKYSKTILVNRLQFSVSQVPVPP